MAISYGKRPKPVAIQAAYAMAFLLLGMTLGFVSKYLDGFPVFPFNVLGALSSRIGIWVFISVVIVSWSRSPMVGALRVLVFLAGALLTYYAYSMKLFGFLPTYYFLRWGQVALASPLGAYIVWYSRRQGWIAALCAALPIGLLASQGYSFLYTFKADACFDLVAAIALFFILPATRRQYLKVLALTLTVAFLINSSDILARLIGGL